MTSTAKPAAPQGPQTLFDNASNETPHTVPPLRITAPGVTLDYQVHGRAVHGGIILQQPNPFKRRKAKIVFNVPRYWPDAVLPAVLRVLAHWFRDIGGFATVRDRHVCHVAARLMEADYTEDQIHRAVNAYAHCECRKHRNWKSISDWFNKADVDRWIDRANDTQQQADHQAVKQEQLTEADAQRKAAAIADKTARLEAMHRQQQERQAAAEKVHQENLARRAAAEHRQREHDARIRAWLDALPDQVKQAAADRTNATGRSPGLDPLRPDPTWQALYLYYVTVAAREAGLPAPPGQPERKEAESAP
ncbi:MAG TPA: hypothetical protein VM243_08375 [Phycisphaerae bacterium]|nr:hypothetical protein [Phycisphaerae bacterium]